MLFGLDLSAEEEEEEEEEERAFISQVAEGLAARVPEGGIPGLTLPVNVEVGS